MPGEECGCPSRQPNWLSPPSPGAADRPPPPCRLSAGRRRCRSPLHGELTDPLEDIEAGADVALGQGHIPPDLGDIVDETLQPDDLRLIPGGVPRSHRIIPKVLQPGLTGHLVLQLVHLPFPQPHVVAHVIVGHIGADSFHSLLHRHSIDDRVQHSVHSPL